MVLDGDRIGQGRYTSGTCITFKDTLKSGNLRFVFLSWMTFLTISNLLHSNKTRNMIISHSTWFSYIQCTHMPEEWIKNVTLKRWLTLKSLLSNGSCYQTDCFAAKSLLFHCLNLFLVYHFPIAEAVLQLSYVLQRVVLDHCLPLVQVTCTH